MGCMITLHFCLDGASTVRCDVEVMPDMVSIFHFADPAFTLATASMCVPRKVP